MTIRLVRLTFAVPLTRLLEKVFSSALSASADSLKLESPMGNAGELKFAAAR